MSLSRNRIIQAAIAIADARGIEAVSMRSIADRLGVRAMSLYHYVRNKAELLDGMHERLIYEMSLSTAADGWEDALRSAAHAYREVALRHPNAFVLMATRPLSTPGELEHITPTLCALDSFGISPERQLFIISAFFDSINGYLLAEVSPTPGYPEVGNSHVARPGEASPSLVRLMFDMDRSAEGTHFLSTHFDAYVEVLIVGLRSVLAGREAQTTRPRT